MKKLHKCFFCGQYTVKHDVDLTPKFDLNYNEFCLDDAQKKLKSIPSTPKAHEITQAQELRKEIKARKDIIRMCKEIIEHKKKVFAEQKCSYCGTPFNEYIMSDEDVKALGYKLYDEYKAFVGDDAKYLPDEILIKIIKHETANGSCYYDKTINKVVINIREQQQHLKHMYPTIFYHEFTHCLDVYDPVNRCGVGRHATWFADFRASEVQIMKMLGYKAVRPDRSMRWAMPQRLTTKVMHDQKVFSLIDYLYTRMDYAISQVQEQFDKTGIFTEECAALIISSMMYVGGEVNFCKNRVSEEDKSLLPNINDIALQFSAPDDERIRQLLEEFDKCATGFAWSDIDKTAFNKIVSELLLHLSFYTPQYADIKHLMMKPSAKTQEVK